MMTKTKKFHFHRYLAYDDEGKQHRESIHDTLGGAVKATMCFLMLDPVFWPEEEVYKNRDYCEYYMDSPGWIPGSWTNLESDHMFELLNFEVITDVIRNELNQNGRYRVGCNDVGNSYFEITTMVDADTAA